MKAKKIIWVILLVLVCAFALAACDDGGKEEVNMPTAENKFDVSEVAMNIKARSHSIAIRKFVLSVTNLNGDNDSVTLAEVYTGGGYFSKSLTRNEVNDEVLNVVSDVGYVNLKLDLVLCIMFSGDDGMYRSLDYIIEVDKNCYTKSDNGRIVFYNDEACTDEINFDQDLQDYDLQGYVTINDYFTIDIEVLY